MRRVDRFVADRTGLSRSYVQKLISEGLLVDDQGRRLRANSEVRGGAVTLEVPPAEVPYHLEPDPTIQIEVVYEDDDLLIVNKPSGLVVHPAPGHWQRHARQCADGPRRPLRRDRGRRPPGHRPPAGPRHLGPADRRPQRRRAGVGDGPAQGAPRPQDLPGAGAGLRRRRGGPDRGAHRARPQGPQADGRRLRRPGGHDRLPRPRALRGLDAPRARSRHGSHAPDPRPPGSPGPPRGGRSGVRDGDLAQGAGRAGAPVPPRLAAGARVAVVVEAGPGGGAAPGCPRIGAGGPSGGRDPRPGGGPTGGSA